MNKKILIFLAFLAIITLITIVMLNIFKKTPKVKEIRKISFSNLNEFTFDYPIFEEWNEEKINNNEGEYVIMFSHTPSKSNSESYAEIKMEITKTNINSLPKIFLENPQGVRYQYDSIESISNKSIVEGQKYIQFYMQDSIVKVELSPSCDDHIFSDKKFFNKVIESFNILDKPTKPQSKDLQI